MNKTILFIKNMLAKFINKDIKKIRKSKSYEYFCQQKEIDHLFKEK